MRSVPRVWWTSFKLKDTCYVRLFASVSARMPSQGDLSPHGRCILILDLSFVALVCIIVAFSMILTTRWCF